jgi:glutamine---fructose-6-phosphate transaminase (isomerizing)
MKQLLGEIMEQPQVLQALLDEEYPAIRGIAAELRERDVRQVLIAARGTSDNAATYAKYLFGSKNHLVVALAAPSLLTVYQAPPRLQHTLVMGISQSGVSPDVVAVLDDARAQGMPTMAITNTADSPLARAAEWVVLCHAGVERSVAATKTYTAELMVLALLSVALAQDEAGYRSLQAIPQAIGQALALHAEIAQRTQRYRYMANCVVIGRGYNHATALELALKLKELTYIGANPYSSADFMHGPIAVVEPGYPVFIVAPSGRMLASLLELAHELADRHAEMIVIADGEPALAYAHTPLPLPLTLEEWLSPLIAIVPGQLLAYHLALAKGLDPEHPRGLHKVTETR